MYPIWLPKENTGSRRYQPGNECCHQMFAPGKLEHDRRLLSSTVCFLPYVMPVHPISTRTCFLSDRMGCRNWPTLNSGMTGWNRDLPICAAEASILAAAEETQLCLRSGRFDGRNHLLQQKKVIAITGAKEYESDGSIKTLYNSFTSSTEYYGDGESDDFQLAHRDRSGPGPFADVLLMHSELTETADGINRVRERAGLPPPYLFV